MSGLCKLIDSTHSIVFVPFYLHCNNHNLNLHKKWKTLIILHIWVWQNISKEYGWIYGKRIYTHYFQNVHSNFCSLFLDNETEECVNFDDHVAIVYKHINEYQYHLLQFYLDWIGFFVVWNVTMFELFLKCPKFVDFYLCEKFNVVSWTIHPCFLEYSPYLAYWSYFFGWI